MEKYMQHQNWSEKLIFGADWEFTEWVWLWLEVLMRKKFHL